MGQSMGAECSTAAPESQQEQADAYESLVLHGDTDSEVEEGLSMGRILSQVTEATNATDLTILPNMDMNKASRKLSENAHQDLQRRMRLLQASGLAVNGVANGIRADRTHDETAFVLSWTLTAKAQLNTTQEELARLHERLAVLVELVGAEVLMQEATSGLLRGNPVSQRRMSAADGMVRLGQLLCRWGAAQGVGLRVGVHTGQIHSLTLPTLLGSNQNFVENKSSVENKRTVWFGSGCAQAAQLASRSAQEWTVHLSGKVKDMLDAFRLVQVRVSQTPDCFYLDHATSMESYHAVSTTDLQEDPGSPRIRNSAPRAGSKGNSRRSTVMDSLVVDVTKMNSIRSSDTAQAMSVTEFKAFLKKNGVDVFQFGKGTAKSLEEFHEGAMIHKRAKVEVKNERIEQCVHLLRISLRTPETDHDGAKELRIGSGEDMRFSGRPPVVVLKAFEHDMWMEATQRFFEQQLLLSREDQQELLAMDTVEHSCVDNSSMSECLPGILTVYRLHTVVVEVVDPSRDMLERLGLPEGNAFSCAGVHDSENTPWTWSPVGLSCYQDDLLHLLLSHGTDVVSFTPRAFEELYDEVYQRQMCKMTVVRGELIRKIKILKVWLHASILNVDHVLAVKAKMQKGKLKEINKLQPISMRMSTLQDYDSAVEEALVSRLSLPPELVQKHKAVFRPTAHRVIEEIGYSDTYPGLKTLYVVNEVSIDLGSDTPREMQTTLGLPAGTDFSVSRQERLEGAVTSEDLVITHWCWKLFEEDTDQEGGPVTKSEVLPTFADLSASRIDSSRGEAPDTFLAQQRVPCPPLVIVPPQTKDSPVAILEHLMQGQSTNWTRAKKAAERIRDPGYNCKDFFDDMVEAFPELTLYCVTDSTGATSLSSSGRTADDEYQRTIGALFTVYWTMRVDVDGKDYFSFGMDSDWLPLSASELDKANCPKDELAKRKAFRENFDWGGLAALLVDAGLLIRSGGNLVHDKERTLAMLVLMTIHDVMKISPLCPKVGRDVNEFRGYKTKDIVGDHDIALSYVLTYHPEVLPSIKGLHKQYQELIKFTHCKLDFNMGWLVQAEAPPGILFRSFKQEVVSGGATQADIAFYFVHWFADLAGAQATPLRGCEKLVLKFPMKVLTKFIESFGLVRELVEKTETEVLEDYVRQRWQTHSPALGPLPQSAGSVAKMRLVMAAQGDSQLLLSTFDKLSAEDQRVLGTELAMTGAADQQFESDDLSFSRAKGSGPAILVYYMPALLQKAGKRDMKAALSILAEVFRRGRDLWPLEQRDVNRSVIIRIDALKELECEDIIVSGSSEAGKSWVVGKSSNADASVRLIPTTDFPNIDWRNHRVLSFGESQKLDVARQGPIWTVGSGKTPSEGSTPSGSRRLGRNRGVFSAPLAKYTRRMSDLVRRGSYRFLTTR